MPLARAGSVGELVAEATRGSAVVQEDRPPVGITMRCDPNAPAVGQADDVVGREGSHASAGSTVVGSGWR